jgi:hypothetical protein
LVPSVHVPLISSQFVVDAVTGGGGVGTDADTGGGWYVGALVTGLAATVTVKFAA